MAQTNDLNKFCTSDIKSLSKLGMERQFLSLMKSIYKTPEPISQLQVKD